jgi:hypothetical protein
VENSFTNTAFRITKIKYLNGNYIAVGYNSADSTSLILTSSDGLTYTRRTLAGVNIITDVAFGNGYYVVCNASGGAVHHSTDLVTWTQASLPSTGKCNTITFANNTFVTGGVSGQSYYATSTPLTWTAATVFIGSEIFYIRAIGANFVYAYGGPLYYTSDFTNYVMPARPTSNFATVSFAAGSDKLLATRSGNFSSSPNTTLFRSTTGVTWVTQNTVANNLVYGGHVMLSPNGSYNIFSYYNDSSINARYLSSADGLTWVQNTPTFLTAYTQAGLVGRSPAYRNTTGSLNGHLLIYQAADSNHYIQSCDISTAGVLSNQRFAFAATNIQSGMMQLNNTPIMVGNPFDGSWRAIGYASNSGSNTGPYYYGGNISTGNDGNYFNGIGASNAGFSTCAEVVPASIQYLMGGTNGWVMRSTTLHGTWNIFIGNPTSGVTNPPGIDFTNLQGVSVASMARSGDLSTSTLVILWANGRVAVSSNQGFSWTMSTIPSATFTISTNYGIPYLQYGNGKFWALNGNSILASSADGITWVTTPENVQSIYNLNSENVFLSATTVATSASGVSDVFSFKATPPSGTGTNTSVERLIYANSKYYLYDTSNRLHTSADLNSWDTSNFSFGGTTINGIEFFNANPGSLAYSGTGSEIVAAHGNVTTPASSGGRISRPFNPTTSLSIGVATASILEIS